jgi:hypothetical protein
MDLILIIIILVLLFGGGFGYRRWGYGGGIGIGGILLIVLIVYLLFGRGGLWFLGIRRFGAKPRKNFVDRGTAFLFEIHGDQGNLQLTATSRASMQRQELNLKGARGDGAPLADLSIPGRYHWIPEGVAPDSRYNVAQLYARLAESIRDGKSVSPGFDAAVTRHRLIDAIVRASETGMKQVA